MQRPLFYVSAFLYLSAPQAQYTSLAMSCIVSSKPVHPCLNVCATACVTVGFATLCLLYSLLIFFANEPTTGAVAEVCLTALQTCMPVTFKLLVLSHYQARLQLT